MYHGHNEANPLGDDSKQANPLATGKFESEETYFHRQEEGMAAKSKFTLISVKNGLEIVRIGKERALNTFLNFLKAQNNLYY